MQKRVSIILTIITLVAVLVYAARWWMPVLGLAGPGNEMVQPLEGFIPWAIWLAVAALALFSINLHWDRILNFRKKPRRLVDEAEAWSDDFRIGAELDASPTPNESEEESFSLSDPVLFPAKNYSLANNAPAFNPAFNKTGTVEADGDDDDSDEPLADGSILWPTPALASSVEESQVAQPFQTKKAPFHTPAIGRTEPLSRGGSQLAGSKATAGAEARKTVSLKQSPVIEPSANRRVTVAFADEPVAELVAIAATATTTSPVSLEEEQELKITPADIAYAATIAQAEAFPLNAQQMPPLPNIFVGRQPELEMCAAVLRDPSAYMLGVVGGLGVGKTTFGLKLAQQLASRYPGPQNYLDLGTTTISPLSLAVAQAKIIAFYQQASASLPAPADSTNESPVTTDQEMGQQTGQQTGQLRQDAYKAALRGKRGILFLDNVANAEQVQALMPPAGNLLLVAAAQEFDLPGLHWQHLGVLDPADAEACLSRAVPRSQPVARQIAETCGYLPLALQLAVSALRERIELTPESYWQKLKRVHDGLSEAGEAALPLTTALMVSYDLLSPGLQKLWRTLAVFPDSFDVTGAGAVWGLHPERAMKALKRLMDFQLLEACHATGRYRLHRSKREFAQTLMSATECLASQQSHAEYYQSALHEADALYEQGGVSLQRGLNLLDLEWHNIQAGHQWATTHVEQVEAARELCSSYPDAGRFVLDLRQHPEERIRWCEAALVAAQQLNRRKAEGRHLIAMGRAYLHLSEIQLAQECYEKALTSTRETEDKIGEARALNGLGAVCQAQSRIAEAREYHTAALILSQAVGDQRNEANALGGLGATHYVVGELPKAVEWIEKQLAIVRRIGDKRGESNALGGLGLAYYSQGEASQAIELLTTQLQLTREIGDRRGEAQSLSHLGHACAELEQYDDSIRYHDQSLVIAREISDRRGEANALGGLGVARFLKGEIGRSIALLEQQLQIAQTTQDQRAEALALGNLGEAYLAQNEITRAVDAQQASYDLSVKIGDLQGQAYALFHRGLALARQGDLTQAIASAEQALPLFEKAAIKMIDQLKNQLLEWRADVNSPAYH